jgi:hypothetical protein
MGGQSNTGALRYVYYVEILPKGNRQSLQELGVAEFHNGAEEYLEMKCLDRHGKEKVANLYRVTKKVFYMVHERDKAGYLFALYIAKGAEQPIQEVYRNGSNQPSTEDNPFRFKRPVRRHRRRRAFISGLTRVLGSIR